MSKTIVIKIKKAGNRLSAFSIKDNFGNILGIDIPKKSLIVGYPVTVEDNVTVITISSVGTNCCSKSWNIPIETLDSHQIAAIQYEPLNTSSIWRHLTNPIIYNTYYGCISPYIIEYPFGYQYNDEILQNIKDYTRAYKYLTTDDGVFNYNRRIETNDYFNKAILYNGQQSSGLLQLVPKPVNNLSEYMKYPLYNIDSKTITYTKSDSFYQYNTFWSLVKDPSVPLFTKSCESLSIDKIINQPNMDYSKRSFKKAPLRAKFLLVRHILDNSSETHLVSAFITTPSQISYK
jgi:hypothetical protein